jgi:hypothetical protein
VTVCAAAGRDQASTAQSSAAIADDRREIFERIIAISWMSLRAENRKIVLRLV